MSKVCGKMQGCLILNYNLELLVVHGVLRVDKVMVGRDIQFLQLTLHHMYGVIIISDSDGLLLPVGLFIV